MGRLFYSSMIQVGSGLHRGVNYTVGFWGPRQTDSFVILGWVPRAPHTRNTAHCRHSVTTPYCTASPHRTVPQSAWKASLRHRGFHRFLTTYMYRKTEELPITERSKTTQKPSGHGSEVRTQCPQSHIPQHKPFSESTTPGEIQLTPFCHPGRKSLNLSKE